MYLTWQQETPDEMTYTLRGSWELDPMLRKPDCTHAACSYEIRQSGFCGARGEIGKCSLVGRAQPLHFKPSADWIMERSLLSSHPKDWWESHLRHSFTAKPRGVFHGTPGHLSLAKWQQRINCPPVPLSNSKRECVILKRNQWHPATTWESGSSGVEDFQGWPPPSPSEVQMLFFFWWHRSMISNYRICPCFFQWPSVFLWVRLQWFLERVGFVSWDLIFILAICQPWGYEGWALS